MAVYSMTGYANASAGPLETPVTQIHPVTDAPPAQPSSGANVNVEIRSVNGRFLDLALRLPDEFRALEPALRELLGAQFKRGKIELRLNGEERRRRRLAAAADRSAEPPGAPRKHGPRLAAEGAGPVGARGAAMVQGRRAGRKARRARARRGAALHRRPARRARARGQAPRRGAAGTGPAPARAREPGRAAGSGDREAPAAALSRALAGSARGERRGADDLARGARRARRQRSGGLRDPHRRRRRAGAPALAPRRDHAAAEGRRRGRQAARLPDPGAAARGQHARLEGGGARAHQHLGRHEGRDRAAARAGAEPR